MFSKRFWRDATERAIKTAAQTVLTVYLVGDQVFNVFDADWLSLFGIALGGAVFSVLTSLGSMAYTRKDGASLLEDI